MRWLSFYHNKKLTFGYVTSDGKEVVDAGARGGFDSLREVLEADALDSLAKEGGDSGDVLLAEIEYAPTITNPKKILCVGLNYKAHQEETGRGGEGVIGASGKTLAKQLPGPPTALLTNQA